LELDRLLTTVRLSFSSQKLAAAKLKLWFSRAALPLSSAQAGLAVLWQHVAPIPSGWSTDVKAELYAKYSRMALAVACPPELLVPAKPHLSEQTRALIKHAKVFKREYFRVGKEPGRWRCRMVSSSGPLVDSCPHTRDGRPRARPQALRRRLAVPGHSSTFLLAFLAAFVHRSHAVTSVTARKDRSAWLAEFNAEVARDVEAGRMGSLWKLARCLAGRAKPRCVAAATVVRGLDGLPLGDSEAVSEAWRVEFGSGGAVVPCEE
jgi:hypothetical protein